MKFIITPNKCDVTSREDLLPRTLRKTSSDAESVSVERTLGLKSGDFMF